MTPASFELKLSLGRRRIAIYGAGGHGKVVWEILTAAEQHVVGFVDDGRAGTTLLELPVVARVEALPRFDGIVVAIGHNPTRRAIFERLRQAGHTLVSAVHPRAIVSEHARLGVGVVVAAGAVVNIHAEIGDNVILNTGCTVDHDCRLGPHVHVAPGAHLGGDVHVEEGAFLGIGTNVIPGKRIGAWATCGAGAVVIADVASDTTVVGVPARPRDASLAPALAPREQEEGR